MIWYESLDSINYTPPNNHPDSTGTLFNFSTSGADVSSEIENTNTGTSGKTCSTNARLTLTNTAPATVARLIGPSKFNDFYASLLGSRTTNGFENNLSYSMRPINRHSN